MFSFLQTAALVGLGSLILTLNIIPKLNGVIRFKKLMDNPNQRSSHHSATPNLGGIAFYICIMIAFYFMASFNPSNVITSLIPGLTIIFILGLKDDLVVLAPLSKLSGQFIAVAFLMFHYSFSIDSLHGFLGIENLNLYLARFLAVFIAVAIMNAINLIDGIDGLAASISLITFSIFGSIFYYVGDYFFVLVCLTMIGSLIGFLFYNLNQKSSKKTFMGDTGSMILGFLIAMLSIRFLALDSSKLALLKLNKENLPLVLIAILIVPLFDTGRIIILRLKDKRSPFEADRNHIHHVIVDRFEISHRRASFYIAMTSFLMILILTAMALYTTQVELLIIFAVFILLAVLFFFYLNNPDHLRWARLKAKRYNKRGEK